ncbi:Ref family recombination enhancement nuclease [Pseudomonas serbica]|uniref:Ref family recombination enhancement nuclease n=1 Tax=Pseudomonas serbica TaxID=2965074 RepID=UPI00237BD26C|nr:Ref family recombination enhancement nuclease [Pseudomonas serbica]
MQGRPVTPAEKLLHDRIAQLGCIACRQHGIFNTHISIHHVHGRTKPGAHMQVLALCEGHHVGDGSDTISVHPWKRRFEERYGKQDDLVAAQWADLGVEYKTPERKAKPINRERKEKEAVAKPKLTQRESSTKPENPPQRGTLSQRDRESKPAKPKLAQRQTLQTPSEQEAPAQHGTLRQRERVPKPEKAVRPAKIASPARPLQSKGQKIPSAKAPKSAQQIAYQAEQKVKKKKLQDALKPELKAQAKEFRKAREAEYLEANKEIIEARKQKAKDDQKRFKADLAAKRKLSK